MNRIPKYNCKKRRAIYHHVILLSFAVLAMFFGLSVSGVWRSLPASAESQQRGLTEEQLDTFAQNNILFYDPGSCIEFSSPSIITASGDFAGVLQAKNANESVFNVKDSDQWYAGWGDGDKEGMKRLLENYGDLAYQLGNAVGAPWVAILVQMRYEDPSSCCGTNNFWGNGCDANHSSYCGASTIQGKNLGEGFVQYGKTLSSSWYEPVRGISDPKVYLETLGPLWVQGDPNGAGYGSIEGMKKSIDALQAYIDSSEGQAIVRKFGNYAGGSSAASSDSTVVSGKDIIWIGDSDSSTTGASLLKQTFPGIENGGWGPSFGDANSYIQACKFINTDDGCNFANPSGLKILEQIIKEGKLRKYLVFALGGNGGWTQDTMNEFIDMVGNDTKVILTTTKYRVGDYTESNKIVKATAAQHPNIYVADVAANYKDEYIDGSNIEFTVDGTKMFVKTIKEALSAATEDSGCGSSEFVWYPQYEGPYSDIEIEVKEDPNNPNSKLVKTTMGKIGCGPFAFAMLANMILPQEITPKDTMEIAIDTGSIGIEGSYGASLTKNLAEHYGLEWKKLNSSSTDASMNDISKHLSEGWKVMTAGGGSKPYTSGGHYVGIRDIDSDGNWLLADSGHTEDVSRQPWKPQDVMTAGMNIDNVYAIRATSNTVCNSSSSNGISYCSDSIKIEDSAVRTTEVIGPIHESSVDVPCDPRTIDLGIRDDAYYDGKRYSIRLCSIPNIPDSDGSKDGHNDGNIHVSSRVAGAFYSMAEEHKKRCGKELVASEGYRTYDEQQYFWNLYQSGQGNKAAQPGYSNHQGGLAVDFNTSTFCSKDSSVVSGDWFNPDFLSQFGLEDGRSFNENWHIQAMEQ